MTNRRLISWLAQNGGCAPVLAVEDANLYLYSGRMAISPVLTFPTSTLYEEAYLDDALVHVMDTGNALRIENFGCSQTTTSTWNLKNVTGAVKNCFGSTGPEAWPVAFTSSNGHVVIRSISGRSQGLQIRAEGQKAGGDTP